MRCKGGGRRGARRGLANHDRQCAVATACTNLVGLVLTCAAGAASAVGALAAVPFRGRAPAGAASAPDAIVSALAADAALPVRADDVSTPSADDGAGPASTSVECALASRCKTSCAPAATPRDDDDAEPRTGTPRRRRLAAIAAMPAAHLAQLLAFVVLCFCVKSADRRTNQQFCGATRALIDFHTGASAADFGGFPETDPRPPVQKVAFRNRSSTCSPSLEVVSTASCPRKERHDRILALSEPHSLFDFHTGAR